MTEILLLDIEQFVESCQSEHLFNILLGMSHGKMAACSLRLLGKGQEVPQSTTADIIQLGAVKIDLPARLFTKFYE